MKRTVIVLTVLGLFLAWPVSAQNLISNSGLEDLTPAFWSPLNGTFGTDVFVTTDTAQSKFSSFKITKAAATAAEVGWLSDNNANKYWNRAASGTYALSAWIKTEGVNTSPANNDERIGVVFTFNDSLGVELAVVNVWANQGAANTSFTNYLGAAILAEAPGEVFVKLVIGKDATGTAYFDGIGCNTTPDWSMGIFNSGAENVNGWLDWYGGKGNYARVTDDTSYSDTYSIELVQPDTMTQMSELVYYTIPYAIEPLEWYKIGVWIKTVGVPNRTVLEADTIEYGRTYIRTERLDKRVNLCYFFHKDPLETSWDPVGGDKFVYVEQDTANTGWTHYVVAEQAPPGATGISMRARFNPDTYGTAYFDDFSITKMVLTAEPVAIEEQDGIAQYPAEYRLAQNFPNPFNPVTTIQFSSPKTGWVRLDVYNILGQRVTTLVDGIYTGGIHDVSWEAVDDRGQPVASGVYIYTLRTNDTRIARKMLLIR